MQLLHAVSSAEALRGGVNTFTPLGWIEADQVTHHPQLPDTSVLIDETPIVAYHSGMSDQHDNQQHNPAADPLTIGELISLQEAAEYAGLTKDSLQGYIKRERLKAKKIGNFWVTTYAAVDEYLQSRNVQNIPKKYRKNTWQYLRMRVL